MIYAQQGDNKSVLRFTLSEGSKSYDLSGLTVKFAAAKADGTYLYNDCAVVGNEIVYAFTDQTAAALGISVCQFKLIGSNSDVKSTPTFVMSVGRNPYSEQVIIDSSSEYTALTAEIALLEQKLANGDFIGEQGAKGDGRYIWDNGYYGLRAAQTAETYLKARQIDGVRFNYKVDNLFTYHKVSGEATGDDDASDAGYGEDDGGVTFEDVSDKFDGYDPSATEGFRLWDYATQPSTKTIDGEGDYKNEISCAIQ